MTYILGARCSDGVVLVGDTKVMIDGGADYTYSKKLTMPLNNVVMGSAGMGGLYKDFQNRIVSAIVRMEKEAEAGYVTLQITTEEEFSVLVNKVIREMHSDYGEDRHLLLNNLMIICATRIGDLEAQLTIFNPFGFPEPVNTIRAIGHGEPYGALFIKNMWNPRMTMEQTAKLGIFIIKFIQDMELDRSVGFSDQCLPQVFYIPDIRLPGETTSEEEIKEIINKHPIRELPEKEVRKFVNEVGSKIAEFEDLFKKGEFRL